MASHHSKPAEARHPFSSASFPNIGGSSASSVTSSVLPSSLPPSPPLSSVASLSSGLGVHWGWMLEEKEVLGWGGTCQNEDDEHANDFGIAPGDTTGTFSRSGSLDSCIRSTLCLRCNRALRCHHTTRNPWLVATLHRHHLLRCPSPRTRRLPTRSATQSRRHHRCHYRPRSRGDPSSQCPNPHPHSKEGQRPMPPP